MISIPALVIGVVVFVLTWIVLALIFSGRHG